jgi:hypothetical protein
MQRLLALLLAVVSICGCEALSNMQVRQAPDGSLQVHSSSVPESQDDAFGLLTKEEGMTVIEDFMTSNDWEEDEFWSKPPTSLVFKKNRKSCAIYYREKSDGTQITKAGTGSGMFTEYYTPAGTEDDIETCLKQLGLAAKE